MKLIVQRISKAKLSIEKEVIAEIGKGYFVLVGIKTGDTKVQATFLAEKLSKLRVMSDSTGKMNLSVKDSKGEMLVVSQFTLYSETKGGNRPGFPNAARPEEAEPLYEYFIESLRGLAVPVNTGRFGTDMKIEAVCDGPVTIILES
jgi:D-tyrosyl-tRNA(Tyr) deacylase